MRRTLLIIIAAVVGVVVVAAVGSFVFFRALAAPPDFYDEALDADPAKLAESSREFETRIAALYSDAQKPQEWQATVTQEEINGWLATEAPKRVPKLFESGVSDPRIVLRPEGASLAFRGVASGFEAIVTLSVDSYVTEQGELAFELLDAKAGAWPLPTPQVVDKLKLVAEAGRVPSHWTQSDGRPVLVVDFEEMASDDQFIRTVESIELHDGEIFLRGSTEQVATATEPPDGDPAAPAASGPDPSVAEAASAQAAPAMTSDRASVSFKFLSSPSSK